MYGANANLFGYTPGQDAAVDDEVMRKGRRLSFEPALTPYEVIEHQFTTKRDKESREFPKLCGVVRDERVKEQVYIASLLSTANDGSNAGNGSDNDASFRAPGRRLSASGRAVLFAKDAKRRLLRKNSSTSQLLTISVSQTPQSPWYPENIKKPILGPKVALNHPLSLASPALKKRHDNKKYYAEAAKPMQEFPSPNMVAIVREFTDAMGPDGLLTPLQFSQAMQELGLDDEGFIEDIFTAFDMRQDKALHLNEALAGFNAMVNGSHVTEVARACFELFNLEGKGYIHQAQLDDIKFRRNADKVGVTPRMVKALCEMFADVLRVEEEQYVANVLLKGKKGKKKKPPPLRPNMKSYVPLSVRRIRHVNFDCFVTYFKTKPELIVAFLPTILDRFLKHPPLHADVVAAMEEKTVMAEGIERALASPESSPVVSPAKDRPLVQPDP